MSFILKIFLVVLFLEPALAYTPEEGNVTATFGPLAYKSHFEDSPTGAHSPVLGGFGLIALGDLNTIGSLEIGMFKLFKLYLREQASQYIVEQKEIIHITMGYRYWINPYFSSSLSLYSSYSLGDPKILHSDFPVGAELDTSARDTTEYGFDLAFQGDLWSNQQWAAVAEVRYSLSVTGKENEKSDHYWAMLGVRYLIQEKYSDAAKKK